MGWVDAMQSRVLRCAIAQTIFMQAPAQTFYPKAAWLGACASHTAVLCKHCVSVQLTSCARQWICCRQSRPWTVQAYQMVQHGAVRTNLA